MIRTVFWLCLIVALAVVCVTVPFGNKTLYGHISAIWHTKEAQDAKNGIEQKIDEVRAGSGSGKGKGTGTGTGKGTGSASPKW